MDFAWSSYIGERERKLDELLMLDGSNDRDLRLFSYESILTATNNFSVDCKLGQGGFGSVYKVKVIMSYFLYRLFGIHI